MIPTSGRIAGTAATSSPVNGHVDPGDARALGEVGAGVPADDAERELRRAGRVRRGHPRVRVLLELERRGPAVLDRVANRWSEPTPGLPPHEKTSLRAHPMPISWS